MSGKHAAERISSFSARRSVSALTAIAVGASVCIGAPLPASARDLIPVVAIRPPAQSVRVDAAVSSVTVRRDEGSATSEQQVAAAAAAEAAAQAAAMSARPVASASGNRAIPTFAPAAQARAGAGAGAGAGAAIVAYAEQYVGVVPYSTGASPAAGFECDGLVQWVYRAFGVDLPRGVSAQAARGIQVRRADTVAGDLVVYPGEHIGIYDGHGGIVDSPDWGRFVSHRPLWGAPLFYRIP